MSFKYCPLCKGELIKKTKTLFVCKKCGFHFYDNPKPTTAIFILKDEKVLLVKRAKKPKKGFWDAPGGFIEKGEAAENSAKREAKEELGIEVENLEYLGSFPGKYLYQGIYYSTLCLTFKTTLKDYNFKLQKEEISQARFFPIKEIPFEKIAFVDVKTGLKKLLSSL